MDLTGILNGMVTACARLIASRSLEPRHEESRAFTPTIVSR